MLNPLVRWAIGTGVILTAICVFALTAYNYGIRSERAKWEVRVVAAEKKARETEAKQIIVTQTVDRIVVQKVAEIQWRTRDVIKEIPTHAPDPSRPSLPNWFVRLHDTATGVPVVPGSAGNTDDLPSSVTDDQALRVIVSNYGSCQADQERLRGWQAWYEGVRSAR